MRSSINGLINDNLFLGKKSSMSADRYGKRSYLPLCKFITDNAN